MLRTGRLMGICLAMASAGASLTAAVPPVPTQANVAYGTHPHQIMDIHVPPQGNGPFPVVMWFGALWRAGKNVPDLNHFFPAGCAVVSVEMRTMEDAMAASITPPISVCLLDARRALQFVRLNAARWKLDPRRIAVAGGSQGSLPALYLGCAGECANPRSADPVERISTRVVCVGAWRSQPSIDPKRMKEWVPGVEWGAPALGCGFAEALRRREEFLPVIAQWSPDWLLKEGAPPIYFEYDWGLTRPADIKEMDYLVHSPRWGLGFQELAREHGVACYVRFPGHPSAKYKDMWDFLVKQLTAARP